MTPYQPLRGVKIAFVFGNLELGGAERQGLLLADFLKRECAADVQVIGLSSSPGRLSELCDELGIRWSGVRFHWGLRRRLPSFLRAVGHLREVRPEILISYTRVPNLVCAYGWKRIGAKLCVWNQADEGLLMNRLPIYSHAVTRPHCFISNSSGGKNFLLNTYRRLSADVHVIHNGVALGASKMENAHWKSKLKVAPESPLVCMIANITAYKDHPTLLRAWQQVLAEGTFSTAPTLVLGGRFDGAENGLLALAEELGIADAIRMPGKIDDVAGLLAASDLFAFSSKSEGIPNAVLEAMSLGLAVVGTDIPGIREAVGPEGAGYLAAIGDSHALADRMLALLQYEGVRTTVGQAMKRRAEEEFGLDAMCQKSAELIGSSLEAVSKAH